MATRMVVCPECGDAVPFGRLACSNCGSLLASVAGSKPAAPTIVDGPDEAPETEPEPEPEPEPGLEAQPEPEPRHVPVPEPVSATDVVPEPPAYGSISSPEAVGPQPQPGAWIPPAMQPDDEAPDPAASPAGASSPAEVPTGTRGAALGISVQRVEEVAGWFVFLAAAVAAAAFVLPWSSVVIGAEGFGGYLDTWGLANPSHALVFIGALVVAGLGYLRPRIVGPWARSGVTGIALGSLMVGLVWPYLLGPLGASVDVVVEGIAAIVLVVGGIAALWAARHARDTSPV